MIPVAAFLSFLLLALPAFAQIHCSDGMGPIDRDAPAPMSAFEFTQAVAAKEVTLAKAFAKFAYRVEVSVQTVKEGAVDGDFHQVADVGFDDTGARVAKPADPAVDTLSRFKLSKRDVDTFVSAPPFALTPDVLAEKDAVYSGRQQIGDYSPSVFDLLPRNDQAPLHGFVGRVWVWPGKSAVLRSCGRSTAYPIAPMRYEIRRERVGEENWFPALIRADEDVRTDDNPVHLRVNVKYSGYKAR
ncbi:hypothetical protein [Enhydrobacter sp.]|jgi:hypothetical protein|uniref:hypothetical protein n=1 Tax=Enhydrobacter sp. TaxID=1894999 RepID=UPI00260F2A0E|nr:hypothetical protein [Enhydrobacter sp.]WIM13962.1 MAG: hypothetical protein OJF58_004931 [Enhydrobacter sp.]